jgi:hypothetical protein
MRIFSTLEENTERISANRDLIKRQKKPNSTCPKNMTSCGRVNLPKYTINQHQLSVEYAKSHILCVSSTIQLLLKIVSERGRSF